VITPYTTFLVVMAVLVKLLSNSSPGQGLSVLVKLFIVVQDYQVCVPALSFARAVPPPVSRTGPAARWTQIIAWLNTCVEITKKLNMPVNNVIKQRQIMTGWKFIS